MSVKYRNALPPDSQFVYQNYKEPLMKVKKGFGFQGVILENEQKTHIQCHICGYFFKGLGNHLVHNHNIKPSEYKEEYGLRKNRGLVSSQTRNHMASRYSLFKKPIIPNSPKALRLQRQGRRRGQLSSKMSMEVKNEKGTCPEQILSKIKNLAYSLGHTPSATEFRREYSCYSTLCSTYGTWNKALKKAGFNPKSKDFQKISEDVLLNTLKEFHREFKRTPLSSDFSTNGLFDHTVYWRRFGSLNNARKAAGLPRVYRMGAHTVFEPNGCIV